MRRAPTRTVLPALPACLVALALSVAGPGATAADRVTINFNPDWRFIKADPPGASGVAFDDGAWALVSAPHTFNDIDTFDDWSTPGHRGEQIQWSGRTWYRKTFRLPESMRGKKVFVEFEGVRQVAEVYLNGHLLGVSKTGFTPFGFDLTPHVTFGQDANVLAVMCDNRFMIDPLDVPNPNLARLQEEVNQRIPAEIDQLAADQIPWNNPHWHPAHGGIYRNVRLHVTDPLHISLPLHSFLATEGPYAYATDITAAAAQVSIEVPIENGRLAGAEAELRVDVLDADGAMALSLRGARAIAAGGRQTITVSGRIPSPRLWDPAYPHVYRVRCAILAGGAVVDTAEVPLGIRRVQFDAASGVYVNGHLLKLRGWGQRPTNEWPGLGAALPDWLHAYTLQLMKDAGANFVRWGHTAAGPPLIAAGDRLGLLTDQPGVDGEHDTVGAAWTLRASAFRDTIIYFRNNPSIVIWEGGNQKVSREHAKELRGYMERYDPHGGRAYAHRRPDEVTAEFMHVQIGTEGGREIAQLPVVEGEYNREESPRRVWDDVSPPTFGYPEARGQTYQLTSEQFAVNQVAQFVRKLGAPEHGGGANWIFSDSTSGGRVSVEVARVSGEVDGVRLPKEAYWVTRAMFRDDPQVHIIGHWTYPAGTKKTVYVVSNADEVELLVNGRSLGRGSQSDRYLFTFAGVVWQPGEIRAVALRNGVAAASQVKRSAGQPVALRLTPMAGPDGLRADGADVVLVDIEAVDAAGERCPTITQRVDVDVAGPGTWRGGYNSGKLDSINRPFLDLEAGIARVAIRASRLAGQITVRARSEGLRSATTTIASVAFDAVGGLATHPPAVAPVPLPARPPRSGVGPGPAPTAPAVRAGMVGRFTKAFDYSGPSAAIVHVETDARDGRNVYVDADATFADLPADVIGADWAQLAIRDASYPAVDLIEMAVVAGATVTVAHDDGLPRPAWLLRLFQPSQAHIIVSGRRMTLFKRRAAEDESLTLGANADTAGGAANMYVVFVSGARRPSPPKRPARDSV